jgi:histidinol dehydrogenase
VRLERRTLTGDPAALAAEIRALAPPPQDVAEVVAQIIERVRAEGDAALIELTEQLDGATPTLVGPRVERYGATFPDMEGPITPALKRAAANVAAVAQAQIGEEPTTVTLPEGQTVTLRE